MKRTIAKILPVLLAGVMLVAMVFALTGCGPVEYVFEAENAALGDETEIQGEKGKTYNAETKDLTGEELAWVSYFGDASWTGDTATEELIWTITSDKDCEATFALYAASGAVQMDMSECFADGGFDWTKMKYTGVDGIDFADEDVSEVLKLTHNNTAVTFDADGSELPGLELDTPLYNNGDADLSIVYRVFGKVTGTVNLVKGENKFVLSTTGVSINVDKLVVTADAKLEWNPTDNMLFEEEEEDDE